MKKLLAVLLIMLLPLSACAETYTFSMTMSADEEGLRALYEPMFAQMDTGELAGVNLDALYTTMYKLFNGFGCSVTIQEDALAGEIRMSGQPLMEGVIYLPENGDLYVTSELLADHALYYPADPQEMVLLERQLMAVMHADWEGALNAIKEAGTDYLNNLDYTTEAGWFTGDAFEGGNICITYELDDRDLSQLVGLLLLPEVRKVASPLAALLKLDPQDTLWSLHDLNWQIASENRYRYIVKIVAQDTAPIGFSLTVLEDSMQVMTASLGLQETSAILVIGAGQDGMNHWLCYDIDAEIGGDAFSVVGTTTQFTAPQDESFAYARKMAGDAHTADWEWHIQQTAEGMKWQYKSDIAMPTVVNGQSGTIAASGTGEGQLILSPFNLTDDMMLYVAEKPALGIRTTIQPDEAIPPMEDGLTLCDVYSTDAEQQELQSELLDKFTNKLTIRLIKLMPAELMSVPQLFALPEAE
ncbi:MAG: hypothetical protein IJ438_04575 [Clostridia bacterium]|nr:hypothetical protein [Clostridia bacterium]